MSVAVCEFCGTTVHPTRAGTFQWTSGWVEARAGGGGHGVTFPVRVDRYACSFCIDLLRNGVSPGQQSLL